MRTLASRLMVGRSRQQTVERERRSTLAVASRSTFVVTTLLALLGGGSAADAQRAAGRAADAQRPVVIASKPFAESYVLAEMFAQLLEARGIPVDRRPGLGATEIAFGALKAGAIDVYPDYTGTGLTAILHEPPVHDARAAYGRVAGEFRRRWGVRWLPPLGFQNTYAIAVRRETARKLGLRTLGDLARAGPRVSGGFTPDFIGRDDGLPGLGRAYGFHPRQARPLVQALKYPALAAGSVDVVDGYSTDGAIARYDLVVLEDDRGFFPPYEAAALVGPRLLRDDPAAVAILTELSGRLDEARMRTLNRRVEVDGEPVARVAGDALRDLDLVSASTGRATPAESRATGTWAYLSAHRAELFALTLRHLTLVAVPLLLAVLFGLPLGVLLARARPGAAEGTVRAVGVLQTIPGIALLAFMIPLLGIGVVPALAALFLYSLYPVVRNTYSGVRDAGPEAAAAAPALGMSCLL
jgi:osmoprotectant transport system permease protein